MLVDLKLMEGKTETTARKNLIVDPKPTELKCLAVAIEVSIVTIGW